MTIIKADERLSQKKKEYHKPRIKQVKNMEFMFNAIKDTPSKIACRQCSGCHGCR